MVLHFLIQGRVQGVGFRWFVHREASELDLRGWVRNTEDGDVEVVASGDEADLAELGPVFAAARAAAASIASSSTHLNESEAEGLSSFRIEERGKRQGVGIGPRSPVQFALISPQNSLLLMPASASIIFREAEPHSRLFPSRNIQCSQVRFRRMDACLKQEA